MNMGLKIPDCGFLVVRHPTDAEVLVPCIIGMNIIRRCRQLVHAEFENILDGKLDSDWRTVFIRRRTMARLAGKDGVHIPSPQHQ